MKVVLHFALLNYTFAFHSRTMHQSILLNIPLFDMSLKTADMQNVKATCWVQNHFGAYSFFLWCDVTFAGITHVQFHDFLQFSLFLFFSHFAISFFNKTKLIKVLFGRFRFVLEGVQNLTLISNFFLAFFLFFVLPLLVQQFLIQPTVFWWVAFFVEIQIALIFVLFEHFDEVFFSRWTLRYLSIWRLRFILLTFQIINIQKFLPILYIVHFWVYSHYFSHRRFFTVIIPNFFRILLNINLGQKRIMKKRFWNLEFPRLNLWLTHFLQPIRSFFFI